jgi:outer membrane protein TolC
MKFRNRETFRSSLVLAAALAVAAGPLSAQRTISADEAVAQAIANNESLKQAAIALEAKRRALGLTWNALLPTVTASAGLSGASVSSSSASLAATGSVSASLSISASLGDGQKLARLEYESQALAYDKAKAQLELTVRKDVCAAVLYAEQLKLAKQNIEREIASYKQTEAKYKAGLASELDLLSAKVSLETLKPTAEGYANTLASAIDDLKNVIGLGLDEELAVSGSLDLPDESITKLLSQAKDRKDSDNRSVSAAANAVEIATITKASLERSKLLPSLAIAASLTPNLPILSSGTSSSSLTTSASALLSVALDNYLPGSAAREAIAEAQDSIDTYKSALKAAVKDAQVARKSDARSVESYRNSLAALKMNVDLAQRTYDASLAAYRNGLETLTTLQSAAGSLESAKLSAISKSYDLLAAVLELEYATGLPLDTIGRF